MIISTPRKEKNLLEAESDQEIVVSEMPIRSVTPICRKHKFEEEADSTCGHSVTSPAKCQRSNSFGSYFVPIVPSIENSVQETQLQLFNDLEIVDTVTSSCQQPESLFHFLSVADSNSASKSSMRQDESHVSLLSADSKCTSNFTSEHVLLPCSHPSCDDLTSDPRFFQSRSAPAQFLTDEATESSYHTTSITTNNATTITSSSTTTTFPTPLEATTKSPVQVTSASDFACKLIDVSSAEKRGLSARTAAKEDVDVNAEDFDNYTTGESSLCDSSRRSLMPSRSAHRENCSINTNMRRAPPVLHSHSDSQRSKVSLGSDYMYTDHFTRKHTRSSSRYRGSSRDRNFVSIRSGSRGKSKSSRSDSRSSCKGTVTNYSRHTTTSYTYTTHTTSSSSHRHNRVNTSRYSEYTETTHSRPTDSSHYSQSSCPRRSNSRDRDRSSRERRKVSNEYGNYNNNNNNYYSRTQSGYYSDRRSPSPARSTHHALSNDTYKNTSHSLDTQPGTSPTVADITNNTYNLYHTTFTTDPDNFRYYRDLSYRDLPLEWWERTDHCKQAKLRHTDRIDHMCGSRESLVLKTTLWKEDIVLEPNMFPYYTPYGVEHYTLWSVEDMSHPQIVSFVDAWLFRHMPHVRRWQYDDNSGERSIDLFHVHVFIETAPFQYAPREGMLYIPPHAVLPTVTAAVEPEVSTDVVAEECLG